MQCPICRTVEPKWKNVDNFRLKPEGMCLCEICGFITYPDKKQKDLDQFYKKEYRTIPNVSIFFTGERKLQYHAHFLKETIDKWKANNRKGLVITDVGSAAGMFLDYLNKQGLDISDIHGVELTETYVRQAWWFFGIKSIPKFDDTKRYDLISSYKSLEHILDPDIELTKYVASLKDDGYLYFSVPLWFEAMTNFGGAGFDLEYYYSPNHCNTWTRKHVEGLIKIAGGRIVKENRTYYDTTYLIQKDTAITDRSCAFEDPKLILEHLEKTFAASEALQRGAYNEAIGIWPNCPIAWVTHYEMNRKALHDQGFEFIYNEICVKALDACKEDANLHYFAGDICYRYEQYEKALDHLNKANSLRPNMPQVFAMVHNCYLALSKLAKGQETKVKFLEQARKAAKVLGDVSMQNKNESINYVMHANAHIPTPFEVAL